MEIIETPAPPRGTKIKHGAKEQQNEWSENWICFILAIRNIGLQHRDGKWNYLLSRKQIEDVSPLPAWYCWINFWIVTFGNIKTLNNFFLDLNIPTNNRTILYYPRDGTSLKWIYKISFELTPAILEKGTFCLFLTLLTTYLNEETKLAIQILNNGKTEYFPPGNAEPCLTHLRHSIHIR